MKDNIYIYIYIYIYICVCVCVYEMKEKIINIISKPQLYFYF